MAGSRVRWLPKSAAPFSPETHSDPLHLLATFLPSLSYQWGALSCGIRTVCPRRGIPSLTSCTTSLTSSHHWPCSRTKMAPQRCCTPLSQSPADRPEQMTAWRIWTALHLHTLNHALHLLTEVSGLLTLQCS